MRKNKTLLVHCKTNCQDPKIDLAVAHATVEVFEFGSSESPIELKKTEGQMILPERQEKKSVHRSCGVNFRLF
jgi:hypothetical protein